MEFIKDEIVKARNGNIDSRKAIYDKYFYITSKFYNMYKDNMSSPEVLKVYNIAMNDYFKSDTSFLPSLFIHKAFFTYYNDNYVEKREMVSNLIKEARLGSISARHKLINHYSYIVSEKAKEYDYLEYEDLVQSGMIKLIETIDIQLKEHDGLLFPEKLIRAIDIYFASTLKKQLKNMSEADEKFEALFIDEDKSLDKKMFELELKSIVESRNLSKKNKLCMLKYYLEGRTLNEIKEELNESKTSISNRVSNTTKLISYNYTK